MDSVESKGWYGVQFVDEGLSDAQRAVMEPPYHGPVFTERPLLNDEGQLDDASQKLITEKGAWLPHPLPTTPARVFVHSSRSWIMKSRLSG